MSRFSIASTITLALGFLLASSAQAAPRQIKVHNIDVGQGSATLIQTMGGKNILIDAGWDFAGPRLTSYLTKVGIKKLDAVVVTHRHMDHIGGIKAVGEKFAVGKFIGPWAKDKIPTSVMAHAAHLRKDIGKPASARNRPVYETATTGKTFKFGAGFKMEALWPKVHSSGKAIADHNEESVALRISQSTGKRGVKPATFLVGGDLGVAEERYVARKMPGKLKVDWMVANHHGSKGSSQREYMVAANGTYPKMLKSLILGRSADKKTFDIARPFYDEVKTGKYAATVLKNLDPLYKPKRPLIPGSRLDRMVKGVKEQIKKEASASGSTKFAVYSAGPNSYGHPNATRLAEAALAGFTPITTWASGASVVMTREAGTDGKWKDSWKPSKITSRGLPFMRMPGWLKHQDQAAPYNNDRREANGHWSKKNPHPEVNWTSADWDVSKSWRTVARQNANGRKAWIEEYVAIKKQAETGSASQKRTAKAKLKRMQYSGKKEWHGLALKDWQELTKPQLKALVQGRLNTRTLKGQGDVKDPVSASHAGTDKFQNYFTDSRGNRRAGGATQMRAPRSGRSNSLANMGNSLSSNSSTRARTTTRKKTTTAKKAPARKKATTRKKVPTRKAPTRKAPTRKAPTRKAPTRKAPTRKAPTRKATTRTKTTTRKATTRTRTRTTRPPTRTSTRRSSTTSRRSSTPRRSSTSRSRSR